MRYPPFDRIRIVAAVVALTLTALPALGQQAEQPKLRTVIKAMMHADASEARAVLDLLDVKYGIKDDQNLIVLRGEGLSSAIHGSDPGENAAPGPPQTPSPVDPVPSA